MASAIWMHGTAAQAEEPWRLNLLLRKGWGTHFGQAEGANWIHIPVGQIDLTMVVNVVFVLYRTTNATVTALHLHDGFSLVQSFDNLTRSGDRLLNNDFNTSQNAWPIQPTRFSGGLGISIQVQFGGFGRPGEILISSAGAYLQE